VTGQMFRGYDRAKYDLRDPSVSQAIKRDRALHEEALATIARHLNTKPPRQGASQVPHILLPPAQQAELESHVPAQLLAELEALQSRKGPLLQDADDWSAR